MQTSDKDKTIESLRKQLQEALSKVSALEQDLALRAYLQENK